MSTPGNQSLERYLEACRTRLKRRVSARGAAAIALGAVAVTGLFALLFVTLVPSSGWLLAARIALYLTLIVTTVLLIRWPLTDAGVAQAVEKRFPVFNGRLVTWRDSAVRGDDSPMLELLTRETEVIANGYAPDVVIPMRDIALPATTAAISIVALILLTTGVTPWQLAAQRLWSGELFAAAAPRITVSPGDVVIPRGTDVVIEAAASGFVASGMEMHAVFEDTDAWETAPMSRLGEGRYGFVFVGVAEQVDYYVGSKGLNSTRHVIHVADLPKVTEVSLSYTFPEWTELPNAERKEGDVAALPDTEIAVTATTDLPVEDPLIVVNGKVQDASVVPDSGGLVSQSAFMVNEPGSWHLAVMHEGTIARISDTFFIDVVEDSAPELAFSWPGHDTQATAIEERTLRFKATDDYGVKSLALSYSVNGSEWVQVDLNIPQAPLSDTGSASDTGPPTAPTETAAGTDTSEHTLYLEELGVASPINEEARPLRPGDMISFYAEAKDHTQVTRTALYFVDVRPFDRTYRESQSMAGQGGNQGGGSELVERQREILSATWNLINKQPSVDDSQAADRSADDDQADVLALLQRTLRDQVTTLIQRAAARRLIIDEAVDTFTTELTLATEDMEPAAEKLEARALNDAIGPEQQALQHLLAAQATMTDVDVSMGQANMRGTAGRSLSELMDLEMDQERNRYETPQSPTLGDDAQPDEEWQRLAELAARQQQLALQQRRGDESLASRWQQERLQRELEELQEELERRRQNAQSSQPQSRQTEQAMENAISELNEARAAIDRSLQQHNGDPSATSRATEAIQRASEQLRASALATMEERLARTERAVENLLSDQRNIMDRLDQVQKDALDARSDQEPRFDDFAMAPYADRKRRMQQDLNDITREIGEMGEAIDDAETKRALTQAADELAHERLDERLAASADAFEFGRPLYAISNEATVERALGRLSNRLGQARRLLDSGDGQAGDRSTLAQVRALRSQLDNTVPGTEGSTGGYNRREMNALLRQADALEFRLGQELGEGFEFDTAVSRAAYEERGTDTANTEALVSIMRDRLDLIEAALLNSDTSPIRAQEPRDQGRDSEAAARYFRDLSRPEG